MDLTNFYIEVDDKEKFDNLLMQAGHQKASGAALRAMIKLFCSDELFRDRVLKLVEDNIVITNKNKRSKL